MLDTEVELAEDRYVDGAARTSPAPPGAGTGTGQAGSPAPPERLRYDITQLGGKLLEITRTTSSDPRPTRGRFRVSVEAAPGAESHRLVLTTVQGKLPSFGFVATASGGLSEVTDGMLDHAVAIVPLVFPDSFPPSGRWSIEFPSASFIRCFLPWAQPSPETHSAQLGLGRQARGASIVLTGHGTGQAPGGDPGYVSFAVEFDPSLGIVRHSIVRYWTTQGVFGGFARLQITAELLEAGLLEGLEGDVPLPEGDVDARVLWLGPEEDFPEGPALDNDRPDERPRSALEDVHLTAGQIVPFVIADLIEDPSASDLAFDVLARELGELGPEAHLEAIEQALSLDDPELAKNVVRLLLKARGRMPEDLEEDSAFLGGLVALPGLEDGEIGLTIFDMLVSSRTLDPSASRDVPTRPVASPEAMQGVLDAIAGAADPARRRFLYLDLKSVLGFGARLDEDQRDFLVSLYSRMLEEAGDGAGTSAVLEALGAVRSPASARKMISLYSGRFDHTDVSVVRNVLPLMGTLDEEESTRFLLRWFGDVRTAERRIYIDLLKLDRSYRPSPGVRAEIAALRREGYFGALDDPGQEKLRLYLEDLLRE